MNADRGVGQLPRSDFRLSLFGGWFSSWFSFRRRALFAFPPRRENFSRRRLVRLFRRPIVQRRVRSAMVIKPHRLFNRLQRLRFRPKSRSPIVFRLDNPIHPFRRLGVMGAPGAAATDLGNVARDRRIRFFSVKSLCRLLRAPRACPARRIPLSRKPSFPADGYT